MIPSDAAAHPCTKGHRFVPGCHELKIVAGNSNMQLASDVAKCLGWMSVPSLMPRYCCD